MGGGGGGGGGREGRTVAGRRLLGEIEDRFQSSSIQLVFNLCFGIYSSFFCWFSFMCLHGCASIPCLNLCFGECRFSICWLNFLIFFLGSRL